ncbi:hypothetical protein PINS_up022670 [Pythium insidiosum]|nr:hypothetical protein PINS_up022670 [Pythium insidiosum]
MMMVDLQSLPAPLFSLGVAVHVLPPRKQSRERASPPVLLSVRHQQRRLQHISRSTENLLELWGNAHAVLSGRPRNALVAALSIGRDGCGAIETLRTADCCECCGLSHLPLVLEGLREVADSDDKKPKTLPMLSRPAPRRNDVSMSSSRLRTVTLNALVQELIVVMAELERQRVLLIKCPHLNSLHKTVAEFFALELHNPLETQTVAPPLAPPTIDLNAVSKSVNVGDIVVAETPTTEVRETAAP